MKIRLTGKTDVGMQRELNEDSFGVLEDKQLVVVCDGMGGHAAGEIASQSAVNTVIRLHKDPKYPTDAHTAFDLPGAFSSEGKFLVSAVRIANSRIYERAQSGSELSGMGTTIVTAILHNNRISICHVGDSRAYRIKNNVLQQLTEDHSWVNELVAAGQLTREQARDFPNRNVITRALGVREKVKVDLREETVSRGDIFLLCTDGLISCLSDGEILDIVSAGGNNLDAIAKNLIAAANSGGGDDNITCVLMEIVETEETEDDDAGFVVFTFPEESDGELRAQKIVGGLLDETEEEAQAVNDDQTAPAFEPAAPAKRNRLYLFAFAVILAAISVVYIAFAFDIAGAKRIISEWLGLGG